MHSFEQFPDLINSFTSQNNEACSILQITIKNYEQVLMLATKEEVDPINKIIISSIEEECQEAGICKILQNNKFYYCLLKEKDSQFLSKVATAIHNKSVSNLNSNIFADVRILGTRITKNIKIENLIRLLSDQIHYIDEHSIFYWIEDPEARINSLKSNYLDLFELRKAISAKTACFAFQPIVKCKTGEIAYHECLLRLSNEDHKLISAGSYIMLAEKYGYITAVDKYVFDMAIEELLSAPNISLSINISNIGVQDKLLVSYIEKMIEKSGVGSRMIIEITETAMNDSYDQTKYFVDSMKSMGCKIALDDFGAGYTSFNQVRRFAVDVIKIDGSFIRDITTNDKNRILVDTLIKTAEELGCKTVAEFVENGEIAKLLIDLKVDYMQGNFFSPALNYRSWEKI